MTRFESFASSTSPCMIKKNSKNRMIFSCHNNFVELPIFAIDVSSKFVAFGSSSCLAFLDVSSLKLLRRSPTLGEVNALKFLTENDLYYTCGETVYFYNYLLNEHSPIFSSLSEINDICISKDKTTILSADDDGVLTLYYKQNQRLKRMRKSHDNVAWQLSNIR